MRAILEYTLPDDQELYKIASDSELMHAAVHDFDQWLRRQIKYSDRHELQHIRDKLYECLSDRNISLD